MNPKMKLTALSSKGGCGCKIGPADLDQVLRNLQLPTSNPNVLIGLDTGDDAGVYKLTDELAMVQTLDFFTPIVDDPYDFGQIAAANALSDVYAMGGNPVTALNIVAFPISTLDKQILSEILRGAGDKLKEADVALIGGHSIDDKEPKFGLSVTGIVHPDKVKTNAGARPGDKLILTKPIGIGIMSSAIKNDLLHMDEIKQVTHVMTTLNKTAAECMNQFQVHAATDVTGFGLLGHAVEMARESGVGIQILHDQVPVLPRARELAEDGVIPGGTKNNLKHAENVVTFTKPLDQVDQWILADAVTSGGLLISVAGAAAEKLKEELLENGVDAHIIGEVMEGHIGKIVVE